MVKDIQHLGRQILFEAPTIFTLIFAGSALAMGQLDPPVRRQLQTTKMQLRHWSKSYWLTRTIMPCIACLSGVTAGLAYYQTKQPMWLIGIAIYFLPVPFTMKYLMPITKQLDHILETTPEPELPESLQEPVKNKLQTWVRLHRVRTVLTMISIGAFFMAKQYSKTQI